MAPGGKTQETIGSLLKSTASKISHFHASSHPAFSNLEILAGSFSVCIPSGLRFRLSGVHSMFLLRDICLYLDELSDGFKEIDSFVD